MLCKQYALCFTTELEKKESCKGQTVVKKRFHCSNAKPPMYRDVCRVELENFVHVVRTSLTVMMQGQQKVRA